jgi:transketolase
MRQRLIYIFTHDSIGLGEDGPTHQPIEHLAMLRGVPHLKVFRPCDALETAVCFELALNNHDGPSAMILTRQNLEFVTKNDDAKLGAYVLSDVENPDAVIIATGSEVSVALQAQEKLKAHQINARVVSAPCFEIFNQQSESYKKQVLGDEKILKIGVEAAIKQGWESYIGADGIFFGMNDFGASAKAEDLFKHFGITAENICEKIRQKLKRC